MRTLGRGIRKKRGRGAMLAKRVGRSQGVGVIRVVSCTEITVHCYIKE